LTVLEAKYVFFIDPVLLCSILNGEALGSTALIPVIFPSACESWEIL